MGAVGVGEMEREEVVIMRKQETIFARGERVRVGEIGKGKVRKSQGKCTNVLCG